MKKRIIFIVIIIISFVFFYLSTEKQLKNLTNMDIPNIDISKIDDGSYNGKYAVFPVEVEVKVTVLNHLITKIDIIKHQNGKGSSAESITDDVIENQTLDVDTMAGATYSSKVILLAIHNALTKAL